jgi:diguanylate cyclase (GGDEF)-like protein
MPKLYDYTRPPASVFTRRGQLSAQLGIAAIGAIILLLRSHALPHPRAALIGLAIMPALAAMLALRGPRLTASSRLWSSCCCALAAALQVGINGQMASPLSGPLLIALALATLSDRPHKLDVGLGVALGSLAAIPVSIGEAFSAAQFSALALAFAALLRLLERLLARAREEANIDPLTKALNRAAFTRLAEARLQNAKLGCQWGVVMIDLDDFGLLNKRQGHLAGDRLLCSAVQRLTHAVGPSGIVGRLGGDEFAALVAADRAEALGRDVLSALLCQPSPISASIGIACSDRDRGDWVALLREADVALRAAKRGGKGQAVVFAEGIDGEEQLKRRHVREAIDTQSIEIVVQPIVDLASGRIHAFEALSRFTGPGPSSPGQWLAMAEPLGMRVELELACLSRSLRLLEQLPAPTRLSVNLSALALHDPRTRSILRESSPERLIIELTEEGLASDMRSLRADMELLLSCGITLAVDDMGAGYSNLRQVVQLAPTMLKLDRTLVRGIDRDPSQRLLIDALTGYAQRTGAEIVAEGIETDSELEVIRALGISYGQGYLLAKPAPPWPDVSLPAIEQPPRRDLARGSRPVMVPPHTTADEARKRFVALPELESLVIVDAEHRPLALITRYRLLTVLGHRFGYALWGEKPVVRIADRYCLRLPEGTPLDELARKSLARPLEHRHDPILLLDTRGRLVGQVTMSDLLMASDPGSEAAKPIIEDGERKQDARRVETSLLAPSA